MTRRMPSLLALLGLVAIAGYQHRDKIADFVKSLEVQDPAGKALESVKNVLGDGPVATTITGGLGQLVDQFKGAGQGDTAESWVGTGPNAPITEQQMESALGADLIDGLVQQTGLDRGELLARLARVLPEAVDKLTPAGQIPA
ncbi:MAG: DUF937 domain-containing protein [Alphaproteobacteria bacterium]|nr:DUF937 domain-containing protein [Alphaproteobacteria bacterium]